MLFSEGDSTVKEVNEDSIYKYYWYPSTSTTTLAIASVSDDTTYFCEIQVSSKEYTKSITINVFCKSYSVIF